MLRVLAPAKVNLTLEVLAREESGYHQLETLFCALQLADEIEFAPADSDVELVVHGAELGDTHDNLVQRAARAYLAARGSADGVRIVLKKHIPHGAGLGGGSSDAAATLLALDRMQREPLGNARLLELGAALGSDVPFFLCGSPLALAWGRGGRLFPLEPLPSHPVLLLVPERGVRTADAYAALAGRRVGRAPVGPRVLRAARLGDWDHIARRAHNDFEEVVFELMPGLAQAKHLLQQHGALLALLAGSGSVVFGVFRDAARLAAAQQAIGEALPGFSSIATATAAPAALPLLL